MTPDWTLMLLAALMCTGSGLFVAVALCDKYAPNYSILRNGTIAALLCIVAGATCGLLNIGHPEMILGALSHPGTPLFFEVILTSLTLLLLLAYLAALLTNAQESTCRTLSYAGAGCAFLLVTSIGAGFVMPWRAVWNTWTLPIAFVGFLISSAAAAFALLLGCDEDASDAPLRFWPHAQAISALCILSYPVALLLMGNSDSQVALARILSGDFALVFWPLVVVSGIVLPLVLSLMRSVGGKRALPLVAFLGIFVGAAAFAFIVWTLGAAQWHFFRP